MPVKFWQTIVRFWFFLSYLITTVWQACELTYNSVLSNNFVRGLVESIDLHLTFGILQFEISSLMSWIFFKFEPNFFACCSL